MNVGIKLCFYAMQLGLRALDFTHVRKSIRPTIWFPLNNLHSWSSVILLLPLFSKFLKFEIYTKGQES